MPLKKNMISTIIFDVNETLFSLKLLEDSFKKKKLSKHDVRIWFNNVLKEGFALNTMGKFIPFFEIGIEELKKIFLQKRIKYNYNDIKLIINSFRKLKSHKEVKPALKILKKRKIKLVTLTNGSKEVTQKLLKENNIDLYIDECFSVDEVKQWKPSLKPYEYVCKKMNSSRSKVLMVAAHGWDIQGAKIAGINTAYITRYEKKLSSYYFKPDIVGRNLSDIAKKFIST